MSKTRNNFNQNDVLKKVRSVYITKKILDNLNQIKLMNIIHYNKKYQKLMKISLKDFKNEFSKIEMEIIPEENTFGKFVNITNKICEENNVRIYFNDKKEEINRNYIAKDDNVKKIKIIINHKIKSLYRFFEDCKCIKKINFIKFNKDDIINMSCMFYNCSSLKKLNLSNFDTNNVTNMSCMFYRCSSLKELNISNFNTNKVTDMKSMFENCSSLKELNLSNFNTNNVIKMCWMFAGCSSLKKLNLSNFNTNKVTDMSWMFENCSSLKELNLSNFNTDNATETYNMFEGCSSLLSLDCQSELIKKEYEKLFK